MKLLLTSAGFENPKIKDAFLKLVNKSPSKIKLIFIPTASRTKEELYYVNWSKKELLSIGLIKDNVKRLDLDHKIKYGEVDGFDVIYVCGGNTFYLLKKVRESGFDKIVKKFLKKGGVYVGVSAGSYIACPTIESATWKHADRNDVGLKDLTALNLVPFLVTAHFVPKYKPIIEKSAANSKYEVKTMTDNQAVLVLDGKIKLID